MEKNVLKEYLLDMREAWAHGLTTAGIANTRHAPDEASEPDSLVREGAHEVRTLDEGGM